MISQAAPSGPALPEPTSPCREREANDLEAAFIYAEDSQDERGALGYVDCCGDIYDASDHRVGHVTAAVEDVGEIYRGYDDRLGYVWVTVKGDGFIYVDSCTSAIRRSFPRGVVTARGEIYRGWYMRKVATAKPPLDVERMGAAALLLGLV